MKEIIIKSPKYGDKICLVDDDDFELVSKYKWTLEKGRTTFYAIHSSGWYMYKGKTIKNGFTIRMHQLILGITPKKEGGRCSPIDHKDHDGLNNQKSNIFLTTNQKNSANSRKSRFKKLVPYKGVTFRNKSHGKRIKDRYIARIRVNDVLINLGAFDTANEAALAYNKAALKYFGEHAFINQIS